MATRQATIDRLLDQLAGAGQVTARRMFGECCLSLDGTPVALVFDEPLFVKLTPAGRELFPNAAEGSPFPGAQPRLIIPTDADGWASREALVELFRITLAGLPPAQPRQRRQPARARR